MKFTQLVNGFLRSVSESNPVTTIYDQEFIAGSVVTTGTAITLPSSKTYTSAELNVFFNGQRLFLADDYNYVGTAPRTQITLTFDLMIGDKVGFVIDRVP